MVPPSGGFRGVVPPGWHSTAWRWTILIVAAVYFLLPLWAALRFAGISAFGSVISEPQPVLVAPRLVS